jgi:hypothetical protein
MLSEFKRILRIILNFFKAFSNHIKTWKGRNFKSLLRNKEKSYRVYEEVDGFSDFWFEFQDEAASEGENLI